VPVELVTRTPVIWLSGTAQVICASTTLPETAWYEPVAHHDPDVVRIETV
jgi:hypothetical protein